MNPEWFYDNVFHACNVPVRLLIIWQPVVDVIIEINRIFPGQ